MTTSSNNDNDAFISTGLNATTSNLKAHEVTNEDDATTKDRMDIESKESNAPSDVVMMDNSNVPPLITSKNDVVDKSNDILEKVLYRLTGGIPKCELNLIVQESNECEAALLEEIRILEEALVDLTKADGDDTAMLVDGVQCATSTSDTDDKTDMNTELIQSMVESQLTPLDRYYTAAALLGRLRNDMAIPSVLSTKTANPTVTTTPVASAEETTEVKAFNEFMDPTSRLYTIYTKTIVDQETLLSLWKKISMNRAAFVFKRPVKSDEAPGYTDRIFFPMDLSLIRKRILTNNIQTYIDFHNALALISHNCVKYNGRDTDYGRVARDFEAIVDHTIIQAVYQEASNLDNASDEAGTIAEETITASEANNARQGTPINALTQSPPLTTIESSINPSTQGTSDPDTTTNEALIITPNDTKASSEGAIMSS